MGTFIVLAGIVLAVVLIIRTMLKRKKEGKSAICGCDCKQCHGQCSSLSDKKML